jgi:fucose 4-O-acetylase-like acetyltransferase
MIMVVMCHTTGVGVPNMNQNFYPRAFWLFMLPCFFLLSGYFFKKEEKFKDMVVKKFRQLLVPYYIFILPVIVYNILNSFQLNCSIAYSFEHTAVHNDPLWFVFSLFFMITLYWIITRSVRSTYMLWGGVIILSLI